MARFMFLQRGGCDNRPEMTPDKMEAQMKACMEWMKSGQEDEWLLDPGAPLSGGAAVVESDLTVIDGSPKSLTLTSNFIWSNILYFLITLGICKPINLLK